MNPLRLFVAKDFLIPASISWYLADLGEFRGKQTQQTDQHRIRFYLKEKYMILIFLVAIFRSDAMIRHAFTTNYFIHTMLFEMQAVDVVRIIEERE